MHGGPPHSPWPCMSRLEDFENSCAAYDKALELGEDYVTLLNYSITLYANDEIEKARKLFARFEAVVKALGDENNDIDGEVRSQGELLKKALF